MTVDLIEEYARLSGRTRAPSRDAWRSLAVRLRTEAQQAGVHRAAVMLAAATECDWQAA